MLKNFTSIVRHHHLRYPIVRFGFIRFESNVVIPSARKRFDSLVSQLIDEIDISSVPTSKEQALRDMTRSYISKNTTVVDQIESLQKNEFLNIFEKDDKFLVTEVVKHVKNQQILNKDFKTIRERSEIKRTDAPLKNYAVFLKYIYEATPDLELIEKFYNYLPSPQPLYIKPVHFEHFMNILVDLDKNTEFFIKVISDLKLSSMSLTLREKSKMINNVFEIGDSHPLDIYTFLKSRMAFDDILLYNAVLKQCVKRKRNVKELFKLVREDMISSKLSPNHRTIELLIKKFGLTKDLKLMTSIVQALVGHKHNIPVDIFILNSLISSCFSLRRFDSAYNLMKWLFDMTKLKTKPDSYVESRLFAKEYGDLLIFYNSQLDTRINFAYLPNFDEGSAHVLLKECLRRAELEKNVEGIFELLQTVEELELVIWEASYKLLFKHLLQIDNKTCSFEDLKKITSFFMKQHETKLPFILSNPVFRNCILDNFRLKATTKEIADVIQDKQDHIKEMFEEFYKNYPKGFQTRTKSGSSKFHEVVMKAVIDELNELVA